MKKFSQTELKRLHTNKLYILNNDRVYMVHFNSPLKDIRGLGYYGVREFVELNLGLYKIGARYTKRGKYDFLNGAQVNQRLREILKAPADFKIIADENWYD